MSNGTYDNSKDGRITGLWIHKNEKYFCVTIPVSKIIDAIKVTDVMAGSNGAKLKPEDAKIHIKLWPIRDKKSDNSPDFNLVVCPAPQNGDKPVSDDDIPF